MLDVLAIKNVDLSSLLGLDKDTPVIKASSLWKFLGVEQEFSPWIKDQILNLGLEEGKDCSMIPDMDKANEGGLISVKECILTVNKANHIAMVSPTLKGREVRLYFIRMEEAYSKATGTDFFKTMMDESEYKPE